MYKYRWTGWLWHVSKNRVSINYKGWVTKSMDINKNVQLRQFNWLKPFSSKVYMRSNTWFVSWRLFILIINIIIDLYFYTFLDEKCLLARHFYMHTTMHEALKAVGSSISYNLLTLSLPCFVLYVHDVRIYCVVCFRIVLYSTSLFRLMIMHCWYKLILQLCLINSRQIVT